MPQRGCNVKHGIWIKIAVSVGLLGWLLAGVDLPRLRAILAGIPAGEGFLVVGLYCAAWLVNAAKWKTLLGRHSYLRLFALTMIGQFYALVLPGQIAGEAVKAWKLIGRTGEIAPAVSSVLMDRVVGVVSLLWVGLVGASVTETTAGIRWTVVFGTLLAGIALAAFLMRLHPCRARSRNAVTAIGDRFPRAAGFAGTLVKCIDAWVEILQSPARLALAMALGVVFQCLAVFILYRIAASIGLQIAFVDWCWIFTAVSLLLLLPVTIGGIGLREGGYVALLAGLGVPGEKALACSLALFGLQLLSAAAGAVLDLVLILRERSEA